MVSHKNTNRQQQRQTPRANDLASQSLLTRRPNDVSLSPHDMTPRNHTGSVKHYRASYFNSPVGATSQPRVSTTSGKSAKTLMIIQINVAGLSHEKCQYLTRVLQKENDIDVAVLQETHVKDASSPQRYALHGYDMTYATYTQSTAVPPMCEKT